MSSLILDNLPWVWVILAAVFVLIETLTLNLTTIWFALGALVLVFVSFARIPPAYQALLFLLISSILLIFTRPLAVKKFKTGKTKTNVDSLIGKTVVVTKAITRLEKGEARLDSLVWTAKDADDGAIPVGTECVIEEIKGVTLIIRRSKV